MKARGSTASLKSDLAPADEPVDHRHRAAGERDTQGGAQFEGRLGDAGGGADPVCTGAGEHQIRGDGDHRPEGETQQHQRKDHGRIGDRKRQTQQHQSRAAHRQPGQQNAPMPPPPDQSRGEGRRHQAHHRLGQRRQTGLQRREITHLPQEDRQEEQRADIGEHDHQLRDDGRGEPALGEQLQVQQRHRHTALATQEHPQQQTAHHEREIRGPEAQPGVGQFGDAVDHTEDAGGGIPDRHQIDRVPRLAARLRQRPGPDGQDQRHHRKVNQQDRPPVEVLEQHTGDRRTQRGAGRTTGAPEADRAHTLAVFGEHGAQQRQRRGHQSRAGHTLHHARDDENPRCRRHGRRGRGGTEGDRGDQQQPLTADPVAQVPHGDQ